MEFNDRIKELRLEKKMSQSQLAIIFDKSEGAIRAWEIKRSKPDVDTLIGLAKYFNCTTDYLLGITTFRNRDELNELKLDNSIQRVYDKGFQDGRRNIIQQMDIFIKDIKGE